MGVTSRCPPCPPPRKARSSDYEEGLYAGYWRGYNKQKDTILELERVLFAIRIATLTVFACSVLGGVAYTVLRWFGWV